LAHILYEQNKCQLFRYTEETIDYIPDLDEVQEEDLAMTVAAAPA
jgi:hypothetical protein